MFKRLCVTLSLVFFFMCGLPAQSPTQQLWWDANTEADIAGYWMYRSLTPCTDVQPSPGTCTDFARINGTIIPQAADPVTYTDTGPLQFQTHYYYRVTAENTSGLESLFSNELDTVHANPNAPAAPGTLRKTEQGANMWLDWDDVEHVNAYNVYKSKEETERGDVIATTVFSNHKDTNPGRIGPRWYWVTSLNENGESQDAAGPVLYAGKP